MLRLKFKCKQKRNKPSNKRKADFYLVTIIIEKTALSFTHHYATVTIKYNRSMRVIELIIILYKLRISNSN